jgi:hypothetical protein
MGQEFPATSRWAKLSLWPCPVYVFLRAGASVSPSVFVIGPLVTAVGLVVPQLRVALPPSTLYPESRLLDEINRLILSLVCHTRVWSPTPVYLGVLDRLG